MHDFDNKTWLGVVQRVGKYRGTSRCPENGYLFRIMLYHVFGTEKDREKVLEKLRYIALPP